MFALDLTAPILIFLKRFRIANLKFIILLISILPTVEYIHMYDSHMNIVRKFKGKQLRTPGPLVTRGPKKRIN